jgi:hypothetical protein
VTDDTSSFNKCLSVAAALGAPNFALLIDGPMFLSTSNINIPGNVQLWFVGAGKLKPGSGRTITLNQTPQAGLWPIFDLSSGGVVVFGANGRTIEVWGEWWGANGDGVTNVANDVPINAALNAIWNSAAGFGGTVRLGAGLFYLSAVINILNYTSLRGLNDWTKVRAKSGWSGGAIMIFAGNGVLPMFDSRLEFLTIDANFQSSIQTMVQSPAWQQRCGIYNCELLNFTQYGFFYNHGYGGAAVLEMANTDFFPVDINGAIGAYFTVDSTVGWLKLNVRNCAFASSAPTPPIWNAGTAYVIGNLVTQSGIVYVCTANNTNQVPPNGAFWAVYVGGSGNNGTVGLWVDGRIVCALDGVDVEVMQYGVQLGNTAVLCGSGIGGGGQTPVIAPNAIVRCLASWSAGSSFPGSINISGAKIGGWTNMISDGNRPYACAALEPYDGGLSWPPNLWKPQGICVVTGAGVPVLSNNTSLGVCSKLSGATIVHNAVGQQTLTFSTSMDGSGSFVALATSLDPAAPQIVAAPASATTVQIFTKTAAGAAVDAASLTLQIFHTP